MTRDMALDGVTVDFPQSNNLMQTVASGDVRGSTPNGSNVEYSASQVRRILQLLFPTRQLVLSQFTFFNQIGVARPTGETSRRGRRCYRLEDLLSIACVLALKEQGIPLKNIEQAPVLVQESAAKIFQLGEGSRLSGFGNQVTLLFPGDSWEYSALNAFLENEDANLTFWSFDVGLLAKQIVIAATAPREMQDPALLQIARAA